MQNILRREEKYPLHLREALAFSHRFSQLLQADENGNAGSYMVRSLYFDTMDDRDFFDKCMEQNVRRKIRLRIYAPDAPMAKLEMKQKENIYQRKRSLLITREDAQALIDGDDTVLLRYPEDFARELFSLLRTECYRPKSIVEYRRKAFLAKENDIRLTFDTEIFATESSFALFSRDLPLYPVLDAERVIFEVKYNHFIPGYLSDILAMVNRCRVSGSKYCMSRALGYPLY